MKILAGICLMLALMLPAQADQKLVMARSHAKAQHVMDVLKETLPEYGYSVAHVQRCDGGMAEFHYKSDFYRVVFFGKLEEVRRILADHPEMSPYLPLKIAVIAENDETVLAAMDPRALGAFFPDDKKLQLQFARWYNDIQAMLDEMRQLKKK
ncbi:DUF302 domain-containing protein [Thiolapillus sp.]|uniref:DUF302 domain-containing protein n=2 Tax=Thiolapillus TaxID=1608298 RepID=A0A831RWG6_9GAMM|nr:DUF302 domain-containing protein [Thiolapillus sp.]HEC07044.1 DUF302 domain-containing protein [Thiolapillus brandeum]